MAPRTNDLVALNRAMLRRSEELFPKPYHVVICGKEFLVHPGVFSPAYADGTEFFTQRLSYRQGDRFLEIGCGIGATAIFAALRGAGEVLAVDINPLAVLNTQENAQTLGVGHIVRAKVSDIFSNVPKQRYQTIYWNMPFLEVPERFRYRSMLERSVFDPSYVLNARFLSEAPQYLATHGRVLVGFGDIGNMHRLRKNAKNAGFRLCHQIAAKSSQIETGPRGARLTFILLELRM